MREEAGIVRGVPLGLSYESSGIGGTWGGHAEGGRAGTVLGTVRWPSSQGTLIPNVVVEEERRKKKKKKKKVVKEMRS